MEVSGFYDNPDGPQYKILTNVPPRGCQIKLSLSLHYFRETKMKEKTQTKHECQRKDDISSAHCERFLKVDDKERRDFSLLK